MEMLVHLLLFLCFISFVFFLIEFVTKDSSRSKLGWGITSFLICILIIIEFYVGTWSFLPSAFLFATYFVNFILAITFYSSKEVSK